MKMEEYRAQIPASFSPSGSASAPARDFNLPQICMFSTEMAGVPPSHPTWVTMEKWLNRQEPLNYLPEPLMLGSRSEVLD